MAKQLTNKQRDMRQGIYDMLKIMGKFKPAGYGKEKELTELADEMVEMGKLQVNTVDGVAVYTYTKEWANRI